MAVVYLAQVLAEYLLKLHGLCVCMCTCAFFDQHSIFLFLGGGRESAVLLVRIAFKNYYSHLSKSLERLKKIEGKRCRYFPCLTQLRDSV